MPLRSDVTLMQQMQGLAARPALAYTLVCPSLPHTRVFQFPSSPAYCATHSHAQARYKRACCNLVSTYASAGPTSGPHPCCDRGCMPHSLRLCGCWSSGDGDFRLQRGHQRFRAVSYRQWTASERAGRVSLSVGCAGQVRIIRQSTTQQLLAARAPCVPRHPQLHVFGPYVTSFWVRVVATEVLVVPDATVLLIVLFAASYVPCRALVRARRVALLPCSGHFCRSASPCCIHCGLSAPHAALPRYLCYKLGGVHALGPLHRISAAQHHT